ncbi:MAG: energy transducer TonB [Alphaproteobacteria bacterium]|nr:energy transducer TonB [Alphaproteobacteria bacterium]
MIINTNPSRMLPITAGATASTFALFYLMQGLVASDIVDLADTVKPIFTIKLYEELKTPDVREIDRVTPPPPVQEIPDTKPVEKSELKPDRITIHPGPIPQPNIRGDRTGIIEFSDGDKIPIVRVIPTYPHRALTNGTEGWVLLEFTVTEYGDVENAVVVDAEPATTFNKSALAAIAKFKYKPMVVDGQPKASHGVRFRMVFDIED